MEVANQMTFDDWLASTKIFREAVVAIAGICGVYIAFRGLAAWKHQLTGNAEYELARRLLRTTYAVRDALRSVRSPLMMSSEIDEAVQNAYPESSEEQRTEADQNAAVYNARWQRVNSALSDLAVERLEGEVLWGTTLNEKFDPLLSSISDLRMAIRRHLQSDGNRRPVMTPEQHEKNDAVVFFTSDDPDTDEFSGQVQTAVATVEDFLRPKLDL